MRVRLTGTGPPGGLPVPGCPCRTCRTTTAPPAAAELDDGTLLGPDPALLGPFLWAPAGTLPPLSPGTAAITLAVIGGPHREAARTIARLRASGTLSPDAEIVLLTPPHDTLPAGPLLHTSWHTTPPTPTPTKIPVIMQSARSRSRADLGRTLLLGGSASGKSGLAEDLLAAEPDVLYLATGPAPAAGDGEWSARVAAHRERRPSWWRTAETPDAATVLAGEPAPVLLDAVGTWLAAALDRAGAWTDEPGWRKELAASTDALVDAWRHRPGRLVAVSDEVGSGVVPDTPSGRLFRTELGRLNQRLAAESDETYLVVAGHPLPLSPP